SKSTARRQASRRGLALPMSSFLSAGPNRRAGAGKGRVIGPPLPVRLASRFATRLAIPTLHCTKRRVYSFVRRVGGPGPARPGEKQAGWHLPASERRVKCGGEKAGSRHKARSVLVGRLCFVKGNKSAQGDHHMNAEKLTCPKCSGEMVCGFIPEVTFPQTA